MKNNISGRLPVMAALGLILLLLCAMVPPAAAEESPFYGDWQLRYMRRAKEPESYNTNPSLYHLEVTMTLNEDGTAQMTEVQDGRTTVFRGTWTSEKKNDCIVAFENSDTLRFRLAKGVLKSYDGREIFTFTQHDTAGEMSLGLPVDAYHFPDANFRAFLINYFYYIPDFTPYLDQKEIKSLQELRIIGNSNITSLEGIRYFTELTTVYCPDLPLRELDVSGLTKLKELDCSNCGLESLNVSGCTQLTTLRCYGNRLKTLDVSGLAKLKEVRCENNLLESLNISGCTQLSIMNCRGNRLASLDASALPRLAELNCEGNLLEELNTAGCTKLATLACGGNSFRTLELNGLSALQGFSYEGGQLETLTLTNCGKLAEVDCRNNRLTELTLSGLSSLRFLYCSGNRLKALDLSACKALQQLYGSDNAELSAVTLGNNSHLACVELLGTAIRELDISGCPKLKKLAVKKKDGTGYEMNRSSKDGAIFLNIQSSKVRVIVSLKITIEPAE